jgi:hypothetical protein
VAIGTWVRRNAFKFYIDHLRDPLWRIPTTRPIVTHFDNKRFGENWTSRDPKENEQTSPPEGEDVTLHGIWAMEFYTPSQIDRLFAGFRNLGWDEKGFPGVDPAQWVRQHRATALGGPGWLNLGKIKRHSEVRWADTNTAPLPATVEYAQGAIFTLTSSLTCVMLQFVYSEDFSSRYNRAVNKARATFTAPSGRGGVSIISPHFQKKAEIEAVRLQARTDAWKWFKSNLPGVFSDEKTVPADFPTCELTTTKITQPFPTKEEAKGSKRSFLEVLGLDRSYEAWKLDQFSGIRFSASFGSEGVHAVVAFRESDLREGAKGHCMGDDRGAMIYFADHLFQRFFSRWGIAVLLSFLQRRVDALRDSAIFRADGRKESLAILASLSDIEFRGLDIGEISAELQRSMRSGWFNLEVTDLVPVEPSSFMGTSLVKNLEARIIEQTRWLQRADEQVRRVLAQQGSLIAIRENIRLQRRMETLTWWIAGLTLLAIAAAIVVPTVIAMEADPDGKKLLIQWMGSAVAWGSRIFNDLRHLF